MAKFLALPKLPGNNAQDLLPDYVLLDAISVVASPRRTRDGQSWTIPITAHGNVLTPMFETEEECREFYDSLKTQLGITE